MSALEKLSQLQRDREQARESEPKRPEPLIRDLPPADPYPIECLGTIMAPATSILRETIQAPEAMCAQSLLSVAALGVQPHRNVVIDGREFPLSHYLFTVGESGERKSAVDQIVVRPIRDHERRLAEEYESSLQSSEIALSTYDKLKAEKIRGAESPNVAIQQVEELGEVPLPPLLPNLIGEEPTYEGIVKLFEKGQPSFGLYSDEGGRMIGGHGMKEDQLLKTICGLSELWDGKRISRIRSGEGAMLLYGRRLSLHLMVQPSVIQQLLSNPLVMSQGIMSRSLTCWPTSTAGTRIYRACDPSTTPELTRYHDRVKEILQSPFPLASKKRNELAPTRLEVASDAKELFVRFHDSIEVQLADGGALAPVRGFANKVPEHALRLAGLLTCFQDLHAPSIRAKEMAAGIELVQFYLGEALRIFHSSSTNPDLLLAQKLLSWAQTEGVIYPVKVYQQGPNAIRDKGTARRIIGILESHGWLEKITEQAELNVDGAKRKDAWRVVK